MYVFDVSTHVKHSNISKVSVVHVIDLNDVCICKFLILVRTRVFLEKSYITAM